MVLGVTGGMARPVEAASAIKESVDTSCVKRFLGMRPWYAGLVTKKDGSCVVGTPDSMPTFVWTIVLNILADLFFGLGILGTFYIMYGGFKYIMSQGEPGKMATAKAIIMRAIIGIVIALLAGVITNTIITILQNAT